MVYVSRASLQGRLPCNQIQVFLPPCAIRSHQRGTAKTKVIKTLSKPNPSYFQEVDFHCRVI